MNVDWYNGPEFITLDQRLSMEERCYNLPSTATPGYLMISRDIFDCHEFMDTGCYSHLGIKVRNAVKHLTMHREVPHDKDLSGPKC